MQLALNGAQAGTWRLDLRTNQVTWDERSRVIFGGDALSFPFDPASPLVHPDDSDRLQEQFREMQASGQNVWDMQFRVLRPDGRIAWVHGVGRAERDSDGELIAYNGINLDVTAAKEAEQALHTTRVAQQDTAEMLQRLLAASAEGILATTDQGIIESANTA